MTHMIRFYFLLTVALLTRNPSTVFSMSAIEFMQCSLGSNFSKQMLAEQCPFVCMFSFSVSLNRSGHGPSAAKP